MIVSPFSVASSLALLSQAANGHTLNELKHGLHLGADKKTVANQFLEQYGLLERGVGGACLFMANQIYVEKGNNINKHLQDVAVHQFHSGIESVDFSQRDATAKAINHFVEKKTQGKIKDLIKPSLLTPDARLVLVNAVYFKGEWEHKFNEKFITKQNFHNSETETVEVDFMHIEDDFNFAYLDDLDASALEMKYAKSNFSFVVVLPNSRTGIVALESKLKHYGLLSIIEKMNKEEVEVDIPKFKVESEIKLNDVLKNVRIIYFD